MLRCEASTKLLHYGIVAEGLIFPYCKPNRERHSTAGRSKDRGRERRTGMQNKQPLVAIVDDDEAVREATKALIRSMGLAAEAFSCGEEFLASPHLGRTVCLVTDINMPGMSGLDLHRHVSALPKRIPTILITAYPNESVRARALAAGARGYLIKPFREDDLLDCIQSALDRGEPGGDSRS
jgi:FixJ family two-component response regulator